MRQDENSMSHAGDRVNETRAPVYDHCIMIAGKPNRCQDPG